MTSSNILSFPLGWNWLIDVVIHECTISLCTYVSCMYALSVIRRIIKLNSCKLDRHVRAAAEQRLRPGVMSRSHDRTHATHATKDNQA